MACWHGGTIKTTSTPREPAQTRGRSARSRKKKPQPKVTFKTRINDQWKDVSSDEIFKGKTVAVFSLPGAYTPTCSSTHLPRYNELAAAFKAKGVDDIVCISVNDPFVMSQWQRDQEAT